MVLTKEELLLCHRGQLEHAQRRLKHEIALVESATQAVMRLRQEISELEDQIEKLTKKP